MEVKENSKHGLDRDEQYMETIDVGGTTVPRTTILRDVVFRSQVTVVLQENGRN